MKKMAIFALSFGVLSLLLFTATDHYKFEIYNAAISFEADKSDLNTKQASISIGDISYYENKQTLDKPSILLVHGFGAYKENWLRFSRYFKDDFHVVIVDLPGHGESVKSLDLSYTIENQVAWLNEFTQKIGLKDFHMAGNSMGGAITALYAGIYPEQVLTATLIDPAGVNKHTAVIEEYLAKGVNPLVVKEASDFAKLMDFALEQKPFIPWPITEVGGLRAIALKEVNEKIWADISIGLDDAFQENLTKIKAPTLIQWGEQDRVINYKNMEVFDALIPESTAHLLVGVGHAPMVEVPQQSASLMIAHIQRFNIKTK
jgi:pimeloyl-ACP methyl ester carboxylesterase